jgi:hypothetical protein
MTSTPAAGLVEDEGSEEERRDGQMTNSTIREGSEGVCEARKSRASIATLGEGRRIHSSSGLPNLLIHIDAS